MRKGSFGGCAQRWPIEPGPVPFITPIRRRDVHCRQTKSAERVSVRLIVSWHLSNAVTHANDRVRTSFNRPAGGARGLAKSPGGHNPRESAATRFGPPRYHRERRGS